MGITSFGNPHDTGRAFTVLPLEIEDNCSSSVLMRARDIVDDAKRKLFDLTCEPGRDSGDLMTIRGKIRGTSAPQNLYRTWVRFDPNTEEFDDGACTCPAFTGYKFDICKHMAALALYFADHPGEFEGFPGADAAQSAAGSSIDLLDYMERLDEAEEQRKRAMRGAAGVGPDGAAAGAGRTGAIGGRPGGRTGAKTQSRAAAVAPGQVTLDPNLTFADRFWSVDFRIRNLANGASYVLKSISRFLTCMASGMYEQYGQKLAFAHTPEMLDDYGRALLGFLKRAIDARENAMRLTRYYMPATVARDLPLSEDEVTQLLRLSEGRDLCVSIDNGGWETFGPARVPVQADEMPVRVAMTRVHRGSHAGYVLRGDVVIDAIAEGADGTYMLVAPAPPMPSEAAFARADAVSTARDLTTLGAKGIANLPEETLRRLGVFNDPFDPFGAPSRPSGSPASSGPHRFVRLPHELEPVVPVLPTLCDGSPDGRFVSDDDLPLFARTLLPLLNKAGVDGDVPQPVRDMQPQPCEPGFYLDRAEDGVICTLKFRYGSREISLFPYGAADRGGAPRDFATERYAEDVVRRYFTVEDIHRPALIGRDETYAIVALFDQGLAAMHAAGSVYTTPAFDRLLAPRPPKTRLAVTMNGGLVDVSLIADEIPPDEVGAFLASYRRKQRFHRLKDGTIVPVGEHDADLDAAIGTARNLGLDPDAFEKGDGTVEVPGFQAFLLDADLDDADKDASFRRYVQDVRVIDPSRYQVPESLHGVLRPYQVEGFRWLQTLYDKGFGGILADEMGLGKSVQFIAMLLARRGEADGAADGDGMIGDRTDHAPNLIVCPASLVYNWAAEFAKFAPSLNVQVVAGTKGQRKAMLAALKGDGDRSAGRDASRGTDRGADRSADRPDVLVTSYDLLRLDEADYKGLTFRAMAIDEAQVIKNHTTKVAKAVKSIDARHRFALTGTPVENRLAELWSIFDFLMPGLLGGFKRFHERYELPISNDAYGDEGRAQAAKLKSLVGVFILRRLKSQVLTDLPDKLENVVTVKLEGEQRKLYAAHEQRLKLTLTHTQAKDFNADRIRILAELTRLRQICCDPRLLYADAKDRSAKLAAIEELVRTCMDEGKKALVFSQFTSFLDLIAERFKARGIAYYTITGETPKKRRVELVDKFNGNDVPAFLISLKAGNTGLNLTGASVVIHADPWWNAAAQEQATDRAHRIGQTRDVNVYQIVAKDTIEERMLKLQAAKSEVARQVLGGDASDGMAAGVASLTRDDLLGLLSA
ncbi:SNF2-related protein [Bifidobacterium vespertilionis]|uniref:DEAD/DEAH box helicase n=1 Tax=Bifidobacterium vespertilionis TaxID=2562524 RepID=UPI001BDC1539|nr:SNF2-related protein [Bifidobacterium vespertilionis]MBT1180141.1 SNF2 helicase associated domain-containing protein [Bifidobacterium vespertilionis]